jgi:acetate---CoA ligase (ADP-forming)
MTAGSVDRDLNRLFYARSVVVIGASHDAERIGGRPLRFLRTHRFPGPLYVVNPKRDQIDGIPSFKDVRDLPEPVDLAIICLPAERCPAAVAACADRGIGAVVVFSGGFGELGPAGMELEREMLRVVNRAGIALLGPNCVGFVNVDAHLPATFAGPVARLPDAMHGDIAFVTQSGAMGTFLYDWAQHQHLAVSHFVSVGNEADLSLGRCTNFLLDLPTVQSLGLHIEGVRDGSGLLQALDNAQKLGKPVCVLKTGRSEAGQRAAFTHTGALAGSDAVFADIMWQYGAVRVSDPQDMLDFLQLCHSAGVRPANGRVGVVSTSGGMGVWVADLLSDFGVGLAEFHDSTKQRLAELLPAYASATNPVDMTGQIVHEPSLVGNCVSAVVDDPDIDTVILVLYYKAVHDRSISEHLAAVAERARAVGKLVVVGWILHDPDHVASLRDHDVPLFSDPGDCVRAVGRYLSWLATARQIAAAGIDADPDLGPHLEPVGNAAPGPVVLTEIESKRIVRAAGFAIPAGRVAMNLADAEAIADDIAYPVVLKGQPPGIAHKAANGLVALAIADRTALRHEFEAMTGQLERLGASGAGILVEKSTPGDMEMIIGTQRDPQFGSVVMFGSGGANAEGRSDVRFMAGPISSAEAQRLILGTRCGAELAATPGGPAAVAELCRAVAALSGVMMANDWIESVEVNPIVFSADAGVLTALDALVVSALPPQR